MCGGGWTAVSGVEKRGGGLVAGKVGERSGLAFGDWNFAECRRGVVARLL